MSRPSALFGRQKKKSQLVRLCSVFGISLLQKSLDQSFANRQNFRLSEKAIHLSSVGARLPSDRSSGDGYTANSTNTDTLPAKRRRDRFFK
ncbi:hypothetical protein PoB_003725900 [Plakobranchus ocellatus]|uniref:Uncharacterized protein n=1 Tax=Plakobranchus ocellatus TaxID=259542 RepID=A0AAV4AX98_9GAST|nr:hypothetical protein PoB_003725900 [Plakobranchus ocellatus]